MSRSAWWLIVGGLAGCGRIAFDPVAASSRTDSGPTVCVPGGTGQPTDPYVLCSAPQLLALMDPGASAMWSASFVLGADVDLAAYSESSTPPVRPIGTVATPFSGAFDGGGHTIANLKESLPAQDRVGLFGAVSGSQAAIHDVRLVNAQIVGRAMVGALVGRLDGGATVSRCSSTGSVIAMVEYVGGLVGIVGAEWVTTGTAATVTASSSSATVANDAGGDWAGGLIGNIGDLGVCADSFATGSVRTRLDFAGGLAGGSTGIIRNSYARGPNTGTLSIAGLAGGSGGQIISSLAVGDVSGMDGTRTGYLIGNNFGTVTMSASYSLATCTAQINGPCHAPLTGETSETDLAQLLDASRPPLSAWDFQNVWLDNGVGQFPTLR